MSLDPRLTQRLAKAVLWAMTVLTVAVLVFIIVFILRKGLPVIDLDFLTKNPVDMGKGGGIFPTIVGTVVLTALAILIATPLGVGTAIYLTEYTWENAVTRVIRFGAECLAGIPSIIFGLFGFIFFVIKLGFGWSILSGGLTLAFMILPTIIRTSEEAIKSVPVRLPRGQLLARRARKWQTVTRVVLPVALPGIVTGHHPQHRPEHRRDGGRDLHRRQRPAGSRRRSFPRRGRWPSISTSWPGRGSRCPNAYGTAAVLIIAILLVNIADLLADEPLHQEVFVRTERTNARDSRRSGSAGSATSSAAGGRSTALDLEVFRNEILGIIGPARSGKIDLPLRPQPAERPRPRLARRGPGRDRRQGHLRPRRGRRRAAAEAGHGLRHARAAAAVDLRQRRLRPAPGRRPRPGAGSTSIVRDSLRKAGLWEEVKDRLEHSGPQALGRPAAAALPRPHPGPRARRSSCSTSRRSGLDPISTAKIEESLRRAQEATTRSSSSPTTPSRRPASPTGRPSSSWASWSRSGPPARSSPRPRTSAPTTTSRGRFG